MICVKGNQKSNHFNDYFNFAHFGLNSKIPNLLVKTSYGTPARRKIRRRGPFCRWETMKWSKKK
jgi:hypothetical protein